ncbi:MAG TPA: DUF3857 domain-containing protein [Pyrinomonadaceae bacterium]|nr:DUF3857 domain-containing protein [Pyrinomonadaceae bacterium]
MLYRIFGFIVLMLLSASFAFAGDEAPAWLQQDAAMKVPAYERDVPAVVLHDEQNVTVGDDGRITIVKTYAVRILTREGRALAEATEIYLTDADKVKDMHAWLIRPNGSVKKYGKDETIDQIEDANDVYNELRVKVINASNDADAGMVFGYQVTTEDRPLFNQDMWLFQGHLPTLLSRYTLALPSGWRASNVTFNHSKLEPSISGSTYTWELHDLAPIEYEPASPGILNLAPSIAINYFPSEGTSTGIARSFDNWAEVSRWISALHDPQAATDDQITAKARELTANAKTEMEKIQAIGRFVQNLQYISIDIGVGHGNGIRPHAASQVLAKAYGDCKDKANLMRALLKAINITAYPVVIYAGDPTFVREEWASPKQFNHCIIAVRVSDDTQAPTILQHPKLGRLLIFDATDENTPVGDLPDIEQGSLALIVAGDDGTLVRMPTTPPESNKVDREANVDLAADGSITATVRERAMGQKAAGFRREFRKQSRATYQKMIEGWVTHDVNGAKVSKVEPTDDTAAGRFTLDVEFTAGAYAQVMQDRLMVFKPAIVARRESLFLTAAMRRQPVILAPNAYAETVRVKLPAGFDVDEMPDPVKLNTPFGSYTTTYEVKDGQLLFTRTMILRATTIPVEQYDQVRNFFARIRAAEQSPVVLAKK